MAATSRARLGWATLAMLAVTIPAWAADVRPTEADIAHCALVARAAIESPAYDERAPSSPFPRRISGIGPYTGAITPIEAQRLPGGTPPPDVRSPATTGVFGAGGFSQEAESEPGSIDPRLRETFDACMRATLEGRSAGPATPPTEAPPTP